MSLHELSANKRKELIGIANSMLNGEANLIEGVRKICLLRHQLKDPEDDVFIPIRAIDSETDHFPLGQLRNLCANEYLEKIDSEMQSYLEAAKEDIFSACRDIIRVYSHNE